MCLVSGEEAAASDPEPSPGLTRLITPIKNRIIGRGHTCNKKLLLQHVQRQTQAWLLQDKINMVVIFTVFIRGDLQMCSPHTTHREFHSADDGFKHTPTCKHRITELLIISVICYVTSAKIWHVAQLYSAHTETTSILKTGAGENVIGENNHQNIIHTS